MLRKLEAGEDPLELAIQKWQDIVDDKGENQGTANCALCQKYFTAEHVNCGGCPVFAKTGVEGCADTPYEELEEMSEEAYYNPPKKIAIAELEFLKSLRKK